MRKLEKIFYIIIQIVSSRQYFLFVNYYIEEATLGSKGNRMSKWHTQLL